VHCPGPPSDLNLPAAHSTHSPPSGPVRPARHLQAVCSELPKIEVDPPAQGVQGPDPRELLYFPASHSWQPLPSCPYQPVLHLQAPGNVLPCGEKALTSQAVHVSEDAAPRASE
jgi:hypothetical protein